MDRILEGFAVDLRIELPRANSVSMAGSISYTSMEKIIFMEVRFLLFA